MSEELKPCPICGATNGKKLKSQGFGISEGSASHPWQFRHIECHGCGLNLTDQETDEEAAEKWNSLHKREKWSTAPPTEPGTYWFYVPESGSGPLVVEVYYGLFEGVFVASPNGQIGGSLEDCPEGYWQKIAEPELPPSE